MHLKLVNTEEKKTAIVFAGGAFKGYYLAHLLKQLSPIFKQAPSIISGSSIGAYTAALYAESLFRGYNPSQTADTLIKLWEKMQKNNPVKFDLLAAFSFKGLCSIDKVRKFMAQYIPETRTFNDYKSKGINLIITGTELNIGSTVYFDEKTSVLEAIIVSGAFPGVFPAIKLNNGIFTDGGLKENMPIGKTMDKGASEVYVFYLDPKDISQNKAEYNIIDLLGRVVDLMMNEIMRTDVETAKGINQLLTQIQAIENPAEREALITQLEDAASKITGRKINLRNKRMIPIIEIEPSANLGGGFDASPKTMEMRKDLAIKDATKYLASLDNN